jgi:hypothetical protein
MAFSIVLHQVQGTIRTKPGKPAFDDIVHPTVVCTNAQPF